ncbi:hypothetical protein EDC96DRAFT_442744, partial [Choanephora cucurbitarum]
TDMNEEYVEWDVHAAEDSSASHLDFEDPLTQHSKQVLSASLPSIIPSSSPILDPSDSFIVTNDNRPSPPTHTKSAPSSSTPSSFSNNNSLDVVEQPLLISMTINVSDPQKHHDPQGAFITYLITTHTEIKTFASESPRPSTSKAIDLRNDKRAQMMHIPASSSLLDSISDTLVNAFAKLRKPDERFESMKENIHRLEENLNTVERLYMRINKRQQDLQNDYQSFANCVQGLSSLESNITNSLCRFADVSRAYAKAMKEMSEKEELQFLNEIHELLAYCHAAKEVLKARDQKQLDFEALSMYLQQTEILLERTQYPGRKFNDRGVGIGGIYISDYVTDKLNEVRGVNMQKARQEKLKRLEQRIKELQNAVTKANDESIGFSSQVSKEYDIFQKTKMMELKQGLIAYADCHVIFYKKGTTLWEGILPVLERIDGAKGDGEFPEV